MRIMDNYNGNGKKIFDFLPDDFPSGILSESWAMHIHGQTLERLNERGGMGIMELLMNLKEMRLNDLISKTGYNYIPTESDARELLSFLPKPE